MIITHFKRRIILFNIKELCMLLFIINICYTYVVYHGEKDRERVR